MNFTCNLNINMQYIIYLRDINFIDCKMRIKSSL